MKRQILNLLRYTENQYDMIVFDLFYYWCNEHALSNKEHQMLITNQALYSWFMRQYQINEIRFLEYIKDYKNTVDMTNELRNLYNNITIEIKFYPKAILNEIKKRAKKGNRITNKQFQSNLN